MNAKSRPQAAPRPNITSAESNRRPGRRWRDNPREWSDDELMLVVRSFAAVDRAVDKYRRKAA